MEKELLREREGEAPQALADEEIEAASGGMLRVPRKIKDQVVGTRPPVPDDPEYDPTLVNAPN